jgi:cytochrome c
MQKFTVAAIAAGVLMLAHHAGAADPRSAESIASSNGCLACHSVDKKVIGPGFKEIAAKYRADKGASANLAQKVKMGSKGAWGEVPMPPNAHVKDDEIKAVVNWILALK